MLLILMVRGVRKNNTFLSAKKLCDVSHLTWKAKEKEHMGKAF